MEINKLREVLNAEGITPADLARETGIASASIARYLKGSKPKEAFVSKIIIAINKWASTKKYNRPDVFPN
ncbi:MAG: helix-turn-helix transcriptional regulator [Culturomica sp.]|jgi:transcriptional regulator with XRE-family HTH domain|nr:helix-turn-helix transcriptional regulator [Culturomica sp.]